MWHLTSAFVAVLEESVVAESHILSVSAFPIAMREVEGSGLDVYGVYRHECTRRAATEG
jgi:hypothetical protein